MTIIPMCEEKNKGGWRRITPAWRSGVRPRTGEEFQAWLESRKLPQHRFARLAGVMPNTVNRWVWRGKRPIPGMAETIALLVEHLQDAVEVLERGPAGDK